MACGYEGDDALRARCGGRAVDLGEGGGDGHVSGAAELSAAMNKAALLSTHIAMVTYLIILADG